MDYDIFISYCRRDLKLVKGIKEKLELTTGVHCWMDLDIESGNPSFTEAIINGIEQTSVFLFMRSQHSQESKYALLELNYANEEAQKQNQKHVVIVNIDNSAMTKHFRFHYSLTDTISWNDLPQREKLFRDIKKWVGKDEDVDYQKLLDQTETPEKLNDIGKELCRYYIRKYSLAVKFFQKASDKGYADAQCHLGDCYEHGRGVIKDYMKAVFYYFQAASQGHNIAQYRLAKCYDNTENDFYNLDMAIRWYREAALQGNPNAQDILGMCYLNGRGVEKDAKEAVKWLTKAAEQGIDTAQYNLGMCYQKGIGIPKDIDEAFRWYSKAAKQGHPTALHFMSERHERVKKDNI